MQLPHAGFDLFHGCFSKPPSQVQQLLGDEPRLQETLTARRAECLSLLKAVPTNPAGYILLTRSCLQLDQPQAALLFADKAISVSAQLHDHHANAQLQLIRATALALGGGRRGTTITTTSSTPLAASEPASSTLSPSSTKETPLQSAATETAAVSTGSTSSTAATAAGNDSSALPGQSGVWTSAEVWECMHSSTESMHRLRASLPSMYHPLLDESLQPEQRIVSHFVLGPASPITPVESSDLHKNGASTNGAVGNAEAAAELGLSRLGLHDEQGVSDESERTALRMLYTMPPVRSLPPGMLLQDDGDGDGEQEVGEHTSEF